MFAGEGWSVDRIGFGGWSFVPVRLFVLYCVKKRDVCVYV